MYYQKHTYQMLYMQPGTIAQCYGLSNTILRC